MKVLVLCYEYPPLGGGGGRVAQAVAEGLVARGHAVRVQTAALGWRSTRETIGGVEVFRTASLRRRADSCSVPEMGLYCATSLLPTLRHIRRWRPDVLHAHFAMPTGALAWTAHQLTGVPYVLTAHLGDVPGGVPEQTDTLFRIVAPVAQRVWRDAAGCTAVSSFVQALAERAYGRKVTRILNGIALGESMISPPHAHLVFLGRFNPQKNAPLLIDALAQVQDLGWRLTMIGDGPDRAAVEARIQRHGLGERIELAGWQPANAVHSTLATADVLCLPSSSEGLPVAAIEALAHGVAIAGTDIPGLRDVLIPGVTGLASPVHDAAAFAENLRQLLNDNARLTTMKHAAREHARLFDLREIVTQYEAVLAEAQISTQRPGIGTG